MFAIYNCSHHYFRTITRDPVLLIFGVSTKCTMCGFYYYADFNRYGCFSDFAAVMPAKKATTKRKSVAIVEDNNAKKVKGNQII